MLLKRVLLLSVFFRGFRGHNIPPLHQNSAAHCVHASWKGINPAIARTLAQRSPEIIPKSLNVFIARNTVTKLSVSH